MWQIEFYTDRRGRSPVMQYIEELTTSEQVKVRNAMRLLEEFGPELHMPHAKQINGNIWELRPGGSRLFYFLYFEKTFVILHGYKKETQKAPKQEIDLAIKRMKELIEEVNHG